jgi:ribosomal protein L32
MLDFICPTCGHFSLEEEVCDSCATPAAEDLVA